MRLTTAAIVLAAGGGSRFRGDAHKLLVPFRGKPMVAWATEAAAAAGLDDVYVVTGAVAIGRDVIPEPAARIVHNASWAEGIATSLQAGVAQADRDGHEAVVVGLGDQPLVPAEAWRAVAACDAPIAVATYDGERRNPVRLHRSVWPLLPTAGDDGARVVIRDRSELVAEVPCTGDPADVDTTEDLDRWN